ncbi:hypothetical protein [Pedobacter sp. SYSU D00535]|uniref:hypothetical protein n=1 Tax=Pedobacter sp. SYSU D00535 TaxID=2810308 RepID=UPI001A96F1C0|nr:hypothetical protein [Pedobacter sp. SYSU D00535]
MSHSSHINRKSLNGKYFNREYIAESFIHLRLRHLPENHVRGRLASGGQRCSTIY